MAGRILILILCFCSSGIFAQQGTADTGQTNTPQVQDELFTHLNAAETYQISGDLVNASIENRAVLAIALQRTGRIAIEEGKYTDAVRYLTESLAFADSASNRTNLAIAYVRQNQFDKALVEAKRAVSLDPAHYGARYILANIYYSLEDYEAALPELERVFSEEPDFEIARALGLTYLNLKQLEKAKVHFAKMAAAGGNDNSDLHVLFAKFYERTNFPAEAEMELKHALAIEPNKPKINFYLGYLLLQNGGSERLGEAGAAFEKELKLTPSDFYSLFFSGVVASSENQHQRAIGFLTKAVEVNPSSGEAFLFLGQSQIEVDDLTNAEKNLRRAIELEANGGKNTQARRTHFMLGRLLLKTGRKEEAQKELVIAGQMQQASLDSSRNEINRILGQVAESSEPIEDRSVIDNVQIELPPEKARQLRDLSVFLVGIIAQSFNNLGVIATQNGQMNDAITSFSAAYEWQPDLPNLSRNLGIVSFRAGEYSKALGPLARQLQINPDDVLVRKLLGSSYYFSNEFDKAVETLKPIEVNLSADAELAYFYGICLVQLKRNQEAVPVFGQLARVSQTNPESLFYAAQGFMILSEYERAVREFRRVLEIAPNTSKANYFVGQGLIRLNRLAEAEQAFSRELEINPGDALSKYHLALTLIDRKVETERAIGILEEAIALHAGYADAYYQLGKIYLEKGETQKAIEQLEKAVTADAEKDYIHYQLSIAYRKMSRKVDADRELEIYKRLKEEKRRTDTPMGPGQ